MSEYVHGTARKYSPWSSNPVTLKVKSIDFCVAKLRVRHTLCFACSNSLGKYPPRVVATMDLAPYTTLWVYMPPKHTPSLTVRLIDAHNTEAELNYKWREQVKVQKADHEKVVKRVEILAERLGQLETRLESVEALTERLDRVQARLDALEHERAEKEALPPIYTPLVRVPWWKRWFSRRPTRA